MHCQQQGDGGPGSMTISEVIKAGSLGHGTAVPGHYDLDIVIYSDSKDKHVARLLPVTPSLLQVWMETQS